MNVFDLRENLIADYENYVKGFLNIRDDTIRAKVEAELSSGLLWPDPLIQINPAFEPGATIDELCTNGTLHPECTKIFQFGKKGDASGAPLRLHKHQEAAILAARAGHNYVLTTGTGSGKSLTYIVPIVDHVLRNGSGRGIQAVIIYPMNALANSQVGELDKFLKEGYAKPPVTYARYTGQEDEEGRKRIQESPPDILLTNYVMLELILTRPEESKIVQAARGAQFLVLDELHTYRGRQGADVAMLTRRAREAFESPSIQCVGTSATLADPEAPDPREEVARVAGMLFGSPVSTEHVIQETLRRATRDASPGDPTKLRARLEKGGAAYEERGYAFGGDPLSAWIESVLGVTPQSGSDRLVRAPPIAIGGENGAAASLAKLTGIPRAACEHAIKLHLVKSYEYASKGDEGARALAFKIHQFLSRGGTPYATLQPEDERYVTLTGTTRHPKDTDTRLYPMVFCRECGHEYYSLRREEGVITPRDFNDAFRDEDSVPLYGYVSRAKPWPDDDVTGRIPADWIEDTARGPKVKNSKKEYLPDNVLVSKEGNIGSGKMVTLVPHPFRFCLWCGVAYNPRLRGDYQKLLSLEREARSSATTILTQSALLGLKTSDFPPEAHKLLSFTDNRQDASLQAGHFNDFNEVGALRSALYEALQKAGGAGLRSDKLPQAVAEALGLSPDDYTITPGLRYGPLEEAQEALRNVLGYRIFRDLERGWRVTSPNLEQCGLLAIDYAHLNSLCGDAAAWTDAHAILQSLHPDVRRTLADALLDHLRHELCIHTPYLDFKEQSRMRRDSQQRLKDPWVIDEDEYMERSRIAFPRAGSPDDRTGDRLRFVGPRSNFGLFLKNRLTEAKVERPKDEDTMKIIHDLFRALARAGIVVEAETPKDPAEVPGFQIAASSLVWLPGAGTTGAVDVLRTPSLDAQGARVNSFFVRHYKGRAKLGAGLRSREHTAQVPAAERQARETAFRTAELPLLFCSPTMELGVDIAQLNVVNMRNVPPSPANYAQRSGRAGRSGQPALVFTYCSRFSPHDQYFFRRANQMVAGTVSPPRIDLTNEDLVRSHVQAIWLSESRLDLGPTLSKVVETENPDRHLQLRESVQAKFEDEGLRKRALERAERVLKPIEPILRTTEWWREGWAESAMRNIRGSFEAALARWRTLYSDAERQSQRQEERGRRASTRQDHDQAERLLREAQMQLRLLKNIDEDWQGDFYSYRYFASEGFLPGYNFPRLPVSAFIPGRAAGKKGQNYLNRPRFIAINEFGPRSIIYHEGSTYRIVKANRTILGEGDGSLSLQKAKICTQCGYVHPISAEDNPDVCKSCSKELDEMALDNLFRLSSVTAQRARRITSDEEERRRLGFDILTGLQYNADEGRTRSGSILVDDVPWGQVVYSPNAEVWRINLGERRRRVKTSYGFRIDPVTGYWAKSLQDDTDEDDASMLNRPVPVIPYVEDHTNCLTLIPKEPLGLEVMASLEAALKVAIQAVYQIEDRELSVESLPTRKARTRLLFWESSEGGAGVLRHLAERPTALAAVARKAMEVLHFDPATGNEVPLGPGREPCAGACYECLLSYFNQPDHGIVNRFLIRDLLIALTKSSLKASPSLMDRDSHFAALANQAESELEKAWLRKVYEGGLNLPAAAQKKVKLDDFSSTPDFTYIDPPLAVYVDGPDHDQPDIQRQDAKVNEHLKKAGIPFERFHYGAQANWIDLFHRHRNVFGGS